MSQTKEDYVRPLDFRHGRIDMNHGAGGFISTTGLGALPPERVIGGARARVGDCVLLSGSIGDAWRGGAVST